MTKMIRFALPLLVLATLSSAGVASGADHGVLVAQAPGKPKAISKEEIIKMSKAGIPDSVIIGKIQKSSSVFKLEVSDIIALKKGGVSDKVIEAMVNTEMGEGRATPTPRSTPRA